MVLKSAVSTSSPSAILRPSSYQNEKGAGVELSMNTVTHALDLSSFVKY